MNDHAEGQTNSSAKDGKTNAQEPLELPADYAKSHASRFALIDNFNKEATKLKEKVTGLQGKKASLEKEIQALQEKATTLRAENEKLQKQQEAIMKEHDRHHAELMKKMKETLKVFEEISSMIG